MKRVFPALPPVLAAVPLGLTAAGWLVAQTLEPREIDQFTSVLFHTLAASTFAVIVFFSALTNAIIVAVRFRNRPASYPTYVLAQSAVVALVVGWLVCLVVGDAAFAVEFGFGIAIAVASVVAFILAVLPDPVARARGAERVALRRALRTPAAARVIRVARVVIPVAAGLGALVFVIVQQTTVVVHPRCVVNGTATVDGAVSIYTENCGDFSIGSPFTTDDVFGRHDITTRGYSFGFPPKPVIIEMVRTN